MGRKKPREPETAMIDAVTHDGRGITATDGKKRSALHLDSPPVFNGMAAANGRLYVAAMDGSVLCLTGKE